MKVKGLSCTDLYNILDIVNEKYQRNIRFSYNPYSIGIYLNFTLRVKDSKLPGHRLTNSGKRWISACWHVHRDFMIMLFNNFPEAYLGTCKISYNGLEEFERHYQQSDQNIGSIIQPLQYSKACECSPNLQLDIRKCIAILKNKDWRKI